MNKYPDEATEVQKNEDTLDVKKPYKTPELITHGKVEKLTLLSGGGIP